MATAKLIFRDETVAEIVDAFTWQLQWDTTSARELVAAIGETLSRIQDFPSIGTATAGGCRSLLVPGYSYLVVYRVEADGVAIVALAHTSRRPGYWRDRISDR